MQQAAVGLHGDAPRIIGDYEIELIYSGLLDGNTDSKKATTEKDPEVAKPESTKSASRSAMSLVNVISSMGRMTSQNVRLQEGLYHSTVLEVADQATAMMMTMMQ